MDVLLDIVAETTKDCSISRQIESIHCKNLPSNKIAFFVDYVIHSIHKSQGTRRKRKQEKKKNLPPPTWQISAAEHKAVKLCSVHVLGDDLGRMRGSGFQDVRCGLVSLGDKFTAPGSHCARMLCRGLWSDESRLSLVGWLVRVNNRKLVLLGYLLL